MARVPIPFFGGPASISFTRERPAGVQTLDALMARQKELARRQADLSTQAYPGQGTIVGGLGNMANQLFAGIGQNRARQEEATGRQELAQAVSGIDLDTGTSSPEALQTIMSRDPDLGIQFLQTLAESRRAQREAAAAAAQRTQDRNWSVEDREDTQSATRQTAMDAATLADRREAERRAYEASQPQTTIAQIRADVEAGRMSPEEGDLAIKKATAIPQVGGTAADRKALWAQQDEYLNSSASIGKLRRASELLTEGIDIGPLAGARTWAGKAGLPGTDADLAARTTEYNNIMTGEAITAMSQALAGATTDTEMARFIAIMNDPATPADVKRRELDTMLAKAQSFNELQAARIGELGGEVPRPPVAPAPPDEERLLDEARKAIANRAPADLVRKRLVEKGIDPGKL